MSSVSRSSGGKNLRLLHNSRPKQFLRVARRPLFRDHQRHSPLLQSIRLREAKPVHHWWEQQENRRVPRGRSPESLSEYWVLSFQSLCSLCAFAGDVRACAVCGNPSSIRNLRPTVASWPSSSPSPFQRKLDGGSGSPEWWSATRTP
ncbi:hypothetical protein B0H19DRAFT_1088312 [Mycena capillaripes]|nr:hypothetical protein B0H19DRAFT_1088312 [Mycena capillaripes]